jgi:hypothetical protein
LVSGLRHHFMYDECQARDFTVWMKNMLRFNCGKTATTL